MRGELARSRTLLGTASPLPTAERRGRCLLVHPTNTINSNSMALTVSGLAGWGCVHASTAAAAALTTTITFPKTKTIRCSPQLMEAAPPKTRVRVVVGGAVAALLLCWGPRRLATFTPRGGAQCCPASIPSSPSPSTKAAAVVLEAAGEGIVQGVR